MRLKGKVVLVTAATRGIGYATVKACAKEGAVVYMAARNMEQAEKSAELLNEEGCCVKCVYNDATKPETYKTMVDEVVRKEGRIDVLVNNFGTSSPAKDLDFFNTEEDVFFQIVNTNIRSVFLASKEAVKYMAQKGGGSIINISSIGGMVPDISQVAYGTSKGAINYLTKLIAVHEAKDNIRCNAILPGMTATEAVKNFLTEEFKATFVKHIPFSRMGTPEDVAATAVFLASDDSAYMTGQLLSVSGGFGMATPLYGEYYDKKNRR